MLPECVNKRGCNKKGGNVKVTDKNHFAGNATEMHAKQIRCSWKYVAVRGCFWEKVVILTNFFD